MRRTTCDEPTLESQERTSITNLSNHERAIPVGKAPHDPHIFHKALNHRAHTRVKSCETSRASCLYNRKTLSWDRPLFVEREYGCFNDWPSFERRRRWAGGQLLICYAGRILFPAGPDLSLWHEISFILQKLNCTIGRYFPR